MINSAIIVPDNGETAYLPHLRTLLKGWAVKAANVGSNIRTVMEVIGAAKTEKAGYIITSNPWFITKLAENFGDVYTKLTPTKKIKKDYHLSYRAAYEGSIFEVEDIKILCLPSLSIINTKAYGKFLIDRYVSKFTRPAEWIEQTEFTYEYLQTAEDFIRAASELLHADYIVSDVETDITRFHMITDHGFTGIYWNESIKKFFTRTYVFDLKSMEAFHFFWKVHEYPQPKIFQNGKYDCNVIWKHRGDVVNYLFDTKNINHCYYSEMPKSLDFLLSFWLNNACYWKWMSNGDRKTQIRYNAMDTWATANVFLAQFNHMPEYVYTNYLEEFPQVFPAMMCEAQGLEVDIEIWHAAQKERQDKLEEIGHEIILMTAINGFNPNSSQQVHKLILAFGHKDAQNADEKAIEKYRFRDVLLGRILSRILDYRGIVKELSTYLNDDKLYKDERTGRFYILYSINPDGTDTGRLASRDHHFGIGFQIQNIPRGDDVKRLGFKYSIKDAFVAPKDFAYAESDYEQAEARDVAYLSGDTNLIAAVDGVRDFHSVNAAAFFGLPYESIRFDGTPEYIDNDTGELVPPQEAKTLNKEIRNLAKRVNHGSNYNMGANVLLQTMGEKNVIQAKVLLNLPATLTMKGVCEYLLNRYEITYPDVKNRWYKSIVNEIMTTGYLVNPLGWTRRCFGNPSKDKRALNAYVAHKPQSLNASTLKKAFMNVFRNIAIHPEHSKNFRLKAQIHDSILNQYRIGHEYLQKMVKAEMEFDVPVVDSYGIQRNLRVPADIKYGEPSWGAIKD